MRRLVLIASLAVLGACASSGSEGASNADSTAVVADTVAADTTK